MWFRSYGGLKTQLCMKKSSKFVEISKSGEKIDFLVQKVVFRFQRTFMKSAA